MHWTIWTALTQMGIIHLPQMSYHHRRNLREIDETYVPIDGEYVKETKIGSTIMDDIFISLNHFKGHECTGFGGALKKHSNGLWALVLAKWKCTRLPMIYVLAVDVARKSVPITQSP